MYCHILYQAVFSISVRPKSLGTTYVTTHVAELALGKIHVTTHVAKWAQGETNVTARVSSMPQAGAILTRLLFSAHKCHFSGLISKGQLSVLRWKSEHVKIQRIPKRSMRKCHLHVKWISHSKSKCLNAFVIGSALWILAQKRLR